MNHSTNVYSAIFPHITSRAYGPEIGDMDEGIVKGREDTSYTEHQLSFLRSDLDIFMGSWMFRTISDLGAEGDILLRGTSGLLWRHGDLLSTVRLDLES